MKEKIQKTYEKFGFLPLDTPVVELSEVLLAKAGGETEKELYNALGYTDFSDFEKLIGRIESAKSEFNIYNERIKRILL